MYCLVIVAQNINHYHIMEGLSFAAETSVFSFRLRFFPLSVRGDSADAVKSLMNGQQLDIQVVHHTER